VAKIRLVEIQINVEMAGEFSDARCDILTDAMDSVDWGRLAREAVEGQLAGADDLAGVTFEEAPDVL